MSLASGGCGGAFARSPSRVPIILGALLRYNRVPSPAKVYSPRQISSAPRLAEPLCMRVCEGLKVSSTGSRSDQYCSRRRPVVVAIGHQYCFTQRPVLVTFRSSLIEWYIYVVRAHESLEDCEPVRLVMERGELPCLSSMWDYLWFVLYYEARPPQRMDRHLGAIRSNTL